MRLLTVVFLAVLLYGQPTGIKPGKVYNLASLKENVLNKNFPVPGGMGCGDYFSSSSKELISPDGRHPIIAFVLKDPNDPTYYGFMLMGRDKFVTIVDPSKSIPTASLVEGPVKSDTGAIVSFHWVIKMSEKDVKASKPCLPTAQK